jgi:hypothetical protein
MAGVAIPSRVMAIEAGERAAVLSDPHYLYQMMKELLGWEGWVKVVATWCWMGSLDLVMEQVR